MKKEFDIGDTIITYRISNSKDEYKGTFLHFIENTDWISNSVFDVRMIYKNMFFYLQGTCKIHPCRIVLTEKFRR